MSHKGKATSDINYNPEDGPEAYSNGTVHSRLSEYTSMAREVHGPEYDPSIEDLDAEVAWGLEDARSMDGTWFATVQSTHPLLPLYLKFKQVAWA
jgi:hypothetical protein